MKISAVLFCLVAVSSSALARSPIRFERFVLFNQPFQERTGCDRVVKMEIDYFEHTAKLENSVLGGCEIAVFPMPRAYRLEPIGRDKCGSWISEGETVQTNDQHFRIRIQDNRQRVCRDRRPALEVTELGRQEGQERRFYTER